jgi:hypothetical protein
VASRAGREAARRSEAARQAAADEAARRGRERAERAEAESAGLRWARDHASEAEVLALLDTPTAAAVAQAARAVGAEIDAPTPAQVDAFADRVRNAHGAILENIRAIHVGY